MNSKGLTFTAVFEAESANYGEGVGNVTSLKKISRGNGETYSYISRQALRYNIVNQMVENSENYKLTKVSNEGTIQFHPEATIKDNFEIDLFGYMKTKADQGATTRSAVVRLSNATSLETFNGDLDFLTNKGLFDRLTKDNKRSNSKTEGEEESLRGGNIAQSEIHKSFYSYTIAIDLDKIGVEGDGDDRIEISNQEKIKRLHLLLKTLNFLYRDIKGRRENISPMFIIGGMYDIKNPFFMNAIKLNEHKLNVNRLQQIIDGDEHISDNTKVGYMDGTFANDQEIKDLEKVKCISVGEFFKHLEEGISKYYNGTGN